MTGPQLADQFVSNSLILSVKALYISSFPLVFVLGWTVKTLYATTIQLSFLKASHDELRADHKQLRMDTTSHASETSTILQEIKRIISPLVQKGGD